MIVDEVILCDMWCVIYLSGKVIIHFGQLTNEPYNYPLQQIRVTAAGIHIISYI